MGKKKILLVDDEKTFTNLIKLSLEDTGKYEVGVENEGSKAAKSARKFKPDLILLDVVMPDMSGDKVAEQLKSDDALKDIPIVFLTALVEEGQVTVHDGIIGGRAFLPKPILKEQLIDCIEKNIRK